MELGPEFLRRIARIVVNIQGGKTRRGTGFLIGEKLVLTAFHVVKDEYGLPDAPIKEFGFLRPETGQIIPAQVKSCVAHDSTQDWALLELQDSPGFGPLPIGPSLPPDSNDWYSFGFSDDQPDLGRGYSGTAVTQIGDHYQLRITGGLNNKLSGLSGAPWIINGEVVGMMTLASGAPGDEGKMLSDGSAYARLVQRVSEKRKDLVPAPRAEPHFLDDARRFLEGFPLDRALAKQFKVFDADSLPEGALRHLTAREMLRGHPDTVVAALKKLCRGSHIARQNAATIFRLACALWVEDKPCQALAQRLENPPLAPAAINSAKSETGKSYLLRAQYVKNRSPSVENIISVTGIVDGLDATSLKRQVEQALMHEYGPDSVSELPDFIQMDPRPCLVGTLPDPESVKVLYEAYRYVPFLFLGGTALEADISAKYPDVSVLQPLMPPDEEKKHEQRAAIARKLLKDIIVFGGLAAERNES